MPRVSALRPVRRDRVRVELDGSPWRTLPAAAVVAAGLRPGVELDRVKARELRHAVRRVEALERAAAALARRDHSRCELEQALDRRGVRASERGDALETMERLGYLDDARLATRRAETLAQRGYGDEAIRVDLERRGLEAGEIRHALGRLEREELRARRLLARRPGADGARTLAARGFDPDTIDAVIPSSDW